MKRISQVIVMSIICIMFTFNLQAQPKVELKNSSFDFGYAPQGSKLSHKYWIHSTGGEDLKIIKVVPGCGCTKTPLEKDIISSGDSTWLEIIFSSKKYTNKITKRPKFFTNDGEKAHAVSFTAKIVAPTTVTSPLVISPFKINLSKQTSANNQHFAKSVQNEMIETELGKVQITNSSDKDLNISIIEFDSENFSVKIPARIKAGETVSGKIIRINSQSNKSFYKSITLEVNDENKTRFTIPVSYISNIISIK